MFLSEKNVVSGILLIKMLEKIILKSSTYFDCWYWLDSVSSKDNIVLNTSFSRFVKWFNGEHFSLKSFAHNMFKYLLM